MTTDEAEELIDEIKKEEEYMNQGADFDYAGSPYFAVSTYKIEKIIKGFANKPPSQGYTVVSSVFKDEAVKITCDKDADRTGISLLTDGKIHTVLFDKIDLRRFVENCTRVMEYLENSD